MDIHSRKIVIIGAGHVGSHVGYALISQGLTENLVFIDIDNNKAAAQALDLFDATVYLRTRTNVFAGNYTDVNDADIMVIAAGPLPDISKGQTRMDTLKQTVEVIKSVADNIKESRFSGIIIIISNPADVITHYLQHVLNWPANKIISTGTTLDSARLRRAMSQTIGIDQKSIYAYVLGEHGESQMVPWSCVTVAGKSLLKLMKDRPDTYGKLNLKSIAENAKAGGWTIMSGKGSTEFGIGASLAEVVRAILKNENRVLPVSALLNGEYGQHNVYASVPALLNKNGVEDIIQLDLNAEEQKQFDASCKTIYENYEFSLTL